MDLCTIPHEFKLVLSYRAFLDYVAQCSDMYRESPKPNNIDRHNPQSFDEWLDMARSYKSTGEIQQFITEEEEWDAWIRFAEQTAIEGVSFNAEGE